MKKRFIQAALAALSALMIATGCSGNTPANGLETGGTAPEASAEAAPGGELIFALGGVISGDILDPHKSGNAQNSRVMRSLYDSLIVELPDHTFKPWLATSWEVSEDKKTYTFKLREDVKFHDGTPFNAEAVKFTFDRIKDPATASVSLKDIGPFESAEVVDPYTVRIHLSSPFAPFLSNVSKETLGIVSPAAAAKYGDRFAQNPVGTGPFRFVKLVPGSEVELERNPDYNWAPATAQHQGPAYLDKLIIKSVPEEATRVGVLQSKQVHAADIIPPQNILSFQSDPAFKLIKQELLNNNYSMYLNVQREPWNDEDIRRAVKLSIDLDAIVKTVYLGTFDRAWSPISPSMFGYDASLENSWKPDSAEAARILDEKGWKIGPDGIREKDGKRLRISFIEFQGNREKRLDVMTMVQQQLKKAGIELSIDSQPQGAYSEKLQKGDYDLVAESQFAADPDVMRMIHSSHNRPAYSPSKVADPELEQWFQEGYAATDTGKRADIYKKIQQKIIDKTYAIPTYVFPYSIASVKEVNGLSFDAHGFPLFYDVWIQK